MSTYFDITNKSKYLYVSDIALQCMYITSMQLVPLLVLVPALPVGSLSELSPELLLIVTAIGKETYASLSIIISFHFSRPIDSKISYLIGYYSTSVALGYLIA